MITFERIFTAIGIIIEVASVYLIYRTELLHDCVDAKQASGKLYSETSECDYLFKENNNE